MIDRIQWLGHGSFFIQGPPLIYINPSRVTRRTFLADVILVGHTHQEHFSVADINKLRGASTRLFGSANVAKEVENCEILRAWQSVQIDRAGIKAIPAYSPNSYEHPISDGGLGFLISVNYFDIYYAGDTGRIPEMSRIHPDIALLPIDGEGTLTVEEAVEVVKEMRPRWVIPFNWSPEQTGLARFFERQVGGRSQVVLPGITNLFTDP